MATVTCEKWEIETVTNEEKGNCLHMREMDTSSLCSLNTCNEDTASLFLLTISAKKRKVIEYCEHNEDLYLIVFHFNVSC